MDILIVDDEVDFCQLISLFLLKDYYGVHCVHCLLDAELHLKSNRPHVILLDHNLPDGLGLDFLIENRNLFDFSHVILITADPSPLIKLKAFNAGIHFLSKPLEIEKIKNLIKMVA